MLRIWRCSITNWGSVRLASAFEISNVVGRYDSQPLIGPSFVFSLVYLPVVTDRPPFGSHADFDFGDSCTHLHVGHGHPGWEGGTIIY